MERDELILQLRRYDYADDLAGQTDTQLANMVAGCLQPNGADFRGFEQSIFQGSEGR